MKGQIPMVIEKSGQWERVYDIYSLLLKERIVFLGTEFDGWVANLIIAQLLFLQREDPDKEISFYINSPGGGVYAGLGIYDTIQQISAPVSTIAVGSTASMATALLASGTKGRRFALPNATIHLHSVHGGLEGAAPDVEIGAKEMARVQNLLFGIFAKHTGQTLEVVKKDFARDHFLTPQEARDYGIIDEILGSKF